MTGPERLLRPASTVGRRHAPGLHEAEGTIGAQPTSQPVRGFDEPTEAG